MAERAQVNRRVFDALDDPSLQQRRIFLREEHGSSEITQNWPILVLQKKLVVWRLTQQ